MSPTVLTIPLALLAAGGCVAGIAYWAVVLWRVRRMMPQVPAVEAAIASAEPPPRGRVSVIVPAHNEARVIADCAKALLAQDHAELEVVFVLDRCTDRTLDILRMRWGTTRG